MRDKRAYNNMTKNYTVLSKSLEIQARCGKIFFREC